MKIFVGNVYVCVNYFQMKKFLLTLLGVTLVLAILFIIANVTFTYSEGSRAGRLIKFATRGYVFKTFEGEMNLGGVTNATSGNLMMNYMWDFSVDDKTVADSLSKLEGRDIRVHYKEKLGKLPWRGETKFIVDKVEEVR
jgi:hypothetical protein